MKNKVPNSKHEKDDTKKKISIDQPFDYEEVAAITGPDYVHNLRRNGLAVLPYEELKKNVPGLKLLEDQCIWMKAGVINFRHCDYDNDCYNCPFDHAMRSAMGEKAPPVKKGGQSNWALKMEERYQITAKPCIHSQSGRLESPEECRDNYACYQCDIHQMLYPENQAETIEEPKYTNVSGLQIAAEYYHHIGHCWVHIVHDGWVRVGMDAFTSKVFGPAETIDLPPVGTLLKRGEIGWVLNRNGLKAPMQSPVSGQVLAVNKIIKDQPAMASNDPYGEGWFLLLDSANLNLNLKGLYFGKECLQWIEKEKQDLLTFLGERYEHLAATGGRLVDDAYKYFSETDWRRLVRKFAHTDEKRRSASLKD